MNKNDSSLFPRGVKNHTDSLKRPTFSVSNAWSIL